MIKKMITPEEIVDFLNELLEVDPNGITAFFNKKAVVNEDLANHPTVQVRKNDGVKFYTMAPLGIVNGMFGVDEDGWGPIYRMIDEETEVIIEFGLVTKELKESMK